MQTEPHPPKRVSRDKATCGCKGNCSRKICGCKKAGSFCDPNFCKCKPETCVNKALPGGANGDDDFKENETVTIDNAALRSPINLDASTMGLGSMRGTVSLYTFIPEFLDH